MKEWRLFFLKQENPSTEERQPVIQRPEEDESKPEHRKNENLILSLNNVNKIEKEDFKTTYVRYKLLKYDRLSFRRHRKFSDRYFSHYSCIRGKYFHLLLAPIEFWEMISGKMLERAMRVWAQHRKHITEQKFKEVQCTEQQASWGKLYNFRKIRIVCVCILENKLLFQCFLC